MRAQLRSALAAAWASALLAGLSTGAPLVQAQTDWKALDQEFNSLLNAGMYPEAEVAAQRRVDLARAQYGERSAYFALTIESLAIVYERQGRLEEAEPLYQQVVAIREKALGTSNAFYAAALNNLALVYQKQNRLDEALPLFERAIAIYGKSRRSDTKGLASMAGNLGQTYVKLGRHDDAVPHYQRVVSLQEKAFGKNHLEVASGLTHLASAYVKLKRHADAAPLYERALRIQEQALGPSDTRVASSLGGLALAYRFAGRMDESVALNLRAIAIKEAAHGRDHPDVLTLLGNLAMAYDLKGQPAEAAETYKRILAAREQTLGPDHPDVASTLSSLAGAYQREGRYPEAVPLLERALAIREKVHGPTHASVAVTLNDLGLIHRLQGQIAAASPLLERALSIREQSLGPDHPHVADSLSNLALIYQAQDRNDDAEPLIRRALAIREKTLSADDSAIAVSLSNLAVIYLTRGDRAAAEPLLKRALAINEKAFGPNDHRTAFSLNNLGSFFLGQGNLAAAEPLLRRALAIREKTLGPEHPNTAQSLNDLAELVLEKGEWGEAGALYERAMEILEKRLGPDHPALAQPLIQEGRVNNTLGLADSAERNFKRALAIRERALGSDHPDTADVLYLLGSLRAEKKDWPGASDYWRRSAGILARRGLQGANAGTHRSGAAEPASVFSRLVKVVHAQSPAPGEPRSAAALEMFETAQRAQSSQAAASIGQMALRGAAGDPKLASLVREHQDLAAEWLKLDGERSAALAEPANERNSGAEAKTRARLAAIDTRISEIDARFAKDFPDFAALTSPAPMPIADVQPLLGDGEALVLFLDTKEFEPTLPGETFIWAVTKDKVVWAKSDIGTKELAEKVARFRKPLDLWAQSPRALAKLEASSSGCAPDTRALARKEDDGKSNKAKDAKASAEKPSASSCAEGTEFNLALAHELYAKLLGPVAETIGDKEHLILVPSGPLTGLPFNALLTEAPPKDKPTLATMKQAPWIVRRHALTILPSASSLKALRRQAKASGAAKPFVGFGNPVFRGGAKPGETRVATRAVSDYFRGALADVETLREALPSLPDTADELKAIATTLAASESDIVLGPKASEATVKSMSGAGTLAQYKVVAFATHGLVAGQLKGLAEPAIALTVPEAASEADDGLLTASEAAGLKLDADWVILSACNTAAGGAPDAEALSGLSRAFFYSGTRAMLVSHWEVDSAAAVRLTTGTFAALKASPSLGRAGAFRASMLDIIDKGAPHEAHPAFWAPFFVVGEGGM